MHFQFYVELLPADLSLPGLQLPITSAGAFTFRISRSPGWKSKPGYVCLQTNQRISPFFVFPKWRREEARRWARRGSGQPQKRETTLGFKKEAETLLSAGGSAAPSRCLPFASPPGVRTAGASAPNG